VISGSPIITLTTDFGLKDNYVGIIKGIISYLSPSARIIDISNDVPPFNIDAARYLLETSYLDFPPGTIHLAIVDPGVGTKRRALIVQTDHYLFIGPDNGLFSFLKPSQIKKIVAITKKEYFLKEASPTFHGRDIFAPVTAHLSRGMVPEKFGSVVKSMVRIQDKKSRKARGKLIGKIVYIDRFGNVVTSFRKNDLPMGKFTVYLDDKKIGIPRKTFGSVRMERPVCYVNSFGYLEIAVNQGSAARYYKVDYSSEALILIAPLSASR
jgi:S-adenosylmethionine hydrolase